MDVSEEMIVEKVQVPARQAVDFGKRCIDRLHIERASAFEKRLLIAKITDVRTPARDDNRVRDQIKVTFEQIATDGRHPGECACSRLVTRSGMPRSIITKKLG